MSPELELQGAIVQRLRADPTVTALVSGRVYDRVEPQTPFPYISYAGADALTDDYDCITGLNMAVQIDCWSRSDAKPGFPEAHMIADAVRMALLGETPPLSLTVNALALFNHQMTRVFRDPDGLTSHAAITFEAVVERK